MIEDSQTGKVTEAEAAKEETAEVPEADEEIKEIDVERSQVGNSSHLSQVYQLKSKGNIEFSQI